MQLTRNNGRAAQLLAAVCVLFVATSVDFMACAAAAPAPTPAGLGQQVPSSGLHLRRLPESKPASKATGGSAKATGTAKSPGQKGKKKNKGNNGAAMQLPCDADAFATTVLPDFIRSCALDEYEACSEECSDALDELVKPEVVSCLAKLVLVPKLFAGKGLFAGGSLAPKREQGWPCFEAKVNLEGQDLTLTRDSLAQLFVSAVTTCGSLNAAVSTEACGNARYAVFQSAEVAAFLARCGQRGSNALVLDPPTCDAGCAAAFFALRGHTCFSRYFTAVDTAATNRTMLSLLGGTRMPTGHTHSTGPDPAAVQRRAILRAAGRICAPPASVAYLNATACSQDQLEAYLSLSVNPLHTECSANVSHPDPRQRFCTRPCDAALQQVLSEPACLSRWSSSVAGQLRSGKGSSAEFITLTRAIQVCAVARSPYVAYSYEAQVPAADPSAPLTTFHATSASHPAVKAMFAIMSGFLVLVAGTTVYQQRHRCSRAPRYQRVPRSEAA